MADSSKQAWVDAVAAGETDETYADFFASQEREPVHPNDADMVEIPDARRSIMTDDQLELDKADIIAALDYRSGPDTLALGSIATARIYHTFGMRYGQGDLRAAIRAGSRAQINEALRGCVSVITDMRDHPTGKCPVCGTNGVSLKAEPAAHQWLSRKGWVTIDSEVELKVLHDAGERIRPLYPPAD